jgi:penicillin-binding protein 2
LFERRLKIFLAILIVFVLVLLARAMQLQVIEREDWAKKAAESMRSETLSETTRGRILDSKGAVLAEDEPCIDACVDYRFIEDPPDPLFLRQTAERRVKDKYGTDYTHAASSRRKEMLTEETALLESQIHSMWEKLAKLSGKDVKEIEELRRSIQERITMRRRVVWYKKFQKALADHVPKEDPPWYHKWIMGEDSDAPNIDDIANEQLGEEKSSHVILQAIDLQTQNELQKYADDYPGLELVPSTHRAYPYGRAACHVIGHLGKVWREDIDSDPNFSDELRAYGPNDVKGRDGLEALGEPTLRGVRGITVIDGMTGGTVSSQPPRPGQDLHSTIDIDLQMQIEEMFTHVEVPYDNARPKPNCDTLAMHGAAVVIELASGNVKALVSAPGYDLNDLDKSYDLLLHDNLAMPLMNRATQSMLEPGSTVKVAVGAGAITDGLLGVNEGIECTGYLVIGGKKYSYGKCWTAGIGKANHLDFAHHPFPTDAPHRGHDGNPDGFLTYSDALERSCNVFFETVADRLKIEGLTKWMKAFGLGRPTGIGIGEARGRTPDSFIGPNRQFATWTSGIGQGPVAATPLQMCNLAATVARRGIWVRPSLVETGQMTAPFKPKKIATGDTSWDQIPSQMDLHLAPAAVAAAIDGMTRVVNSRAGTGTSARRNDILVAGKTGTAQASRFLEPKLDAEDHIIRDENGKAQMELLPASTHDHPNPRAPWYRAIDPEGEKFDHAWFIGFVPANNPQYAISVMVEYGGGGGGAVAGPIASQIIDALVEHGYLHPTKVARAEN